MKLIISSVFAAALVSSASANCDDIGSNAAGELMMNYGCFPQSTSNTSGASCDDASRAIEACKIYIDMYWCGDSYGANKRTLKNQCKWQVLQNEESGAEEEVVFSEDSGDNEDEDAPVPAVNTYLRAQCGKYTGAIPAAQAAVNIVDDIWRSSGERCGYANSAFTSDAERALRNEFPDNCRAENAIRANQGGRRAGEHKINKIVSSCSRPVPRPTRPPREPTYPPTWPNRPPTGRITRQDIRNACGHVKNCNGCKKQCSGRDIKDACKAQYCSIEEMLEDDFETSLSE